MADPIGVTFAPTDEQALMSRRNWQTQGGTPEAIRVLSLHVPRVLGGQGVTPPGISPLVGARGRGGPDVAAVVRSVLQAMGQDVSGLGGGPGFEGAAGGMGSPMAEPGALSAQIGQTLGGYGGGGSAPAPTVIPGIGLPGGMPGQPTVPQDQSGPSMTPTFQSTLDRWTSRRPRFGGMGGMGLPNVLGGRR